MRVKKKKVETRKQRGWNYVLGYSGCFLIISLCVFSFFYLNGKTFIWAYDGIPQHFNALLYYREWLREIFSTLLTEHRLEIPMWSMDIGYGADIITTLNYYVLGDPLTLLAAFVPKEAWMDEFYSLLILLRIYLSGLSFSAYCLYRKNEKFPTLMGALLYAFCFWTILGAVRHPYFMNPMIYFPLILMGIEKIFEKKSSRLYIGMLAVSVISNFYFGYMICFMILGYCAARYVRIFGKIRIREMAPWVGKFLGFSLISILLAAVTLIPVAICLFSAGRFQSERAIPLLYPSSYYSWLIPAVLTGGAGYWNNMGYTAFGVVAIFLLFLQRKKRTVYKVSLLLMFGCMLLPYAGHVLNGFSYETNRFSWAAAMIVAYLFVKIWPDLSCLTEKQKKGLAAATILYAGICLVNEKCRMEMALAALVTLGILVCVLNCREWLVKSEKVFRGVMLSGLILCLILQGAYQYSPQEENYLADFTENNEALLALTDNSATAVAAELADGSVWRYDQYGTTRWYNEALQLGVHGVASYWSLSENSYGEFQRELYLNQDLDYRYTGLDGRSFLDALASVRYFGVHSGAEGYLPYGYSRNAATRWIGEDAQQAAQAEAQGQTVQGLDASKISVYENDNWLPLGYTYDRWISREEYETLSVTEKQQALLQGIVLEDSSLERAEPEYEDVTVEYTETIGDGIERTENGIFVRKPGASMTLTFTGIPQSETYLIIEGLDFEGVRPSEQYTEEEWERLTVYEQNQVKQEDRNWTKAEGAAIQVVCGTVSKNLNYLNEAGGFNTGKVDFLVNTGYREETADSITLNFMNAGYYTFEEISVVCQPTAKLAEYTAARKENVLENIVLDANEISGTIHADRAEALLIAIPYNQGWTAWVDGAETELKKANTMYVALELEEGDHEIVLRYRTPGITAGVTLSLGTAAGSVIWWGISRTLRQRRLAKRKRNSFIFFVNMIS